MNDQLIFSDGGTLYISLESKIRTWVKVLLILVNVVLYSLPIIILTYVPSKETGSSIFVVVAMSTVFFFIATRPTIWNIFGRECMVITIDKFSFYRDFGLYKTPVQNIEIECGLTTYAEQVLAYESESYVIITFCENLPNEEHREILTTSIKTPVKNYKIIQNLLNEIFEKPEDSYSYLMN